MAQFSLQEKRNRLLPKGDARQGRVKTKRYYYARQHEEQVLDLKLQGKSTRVIAQAVGISESQVRRYLDRVLDATAERLDADANALRILEQRRLDKLWELIWPIAMADGRLGEIDPDSGEIVPICADTQLKAVDRLVNLHKARAKLLGLTIDEVTINPDEAAFMLVGEAIARVVRDPETLRAIRGEFARIAKQGLTGGDLPQLPAPAIDGEYLELPDEDAEELPE